MTSAPAAPPLAAAAARRRSGTASKATTRRADAAAGAATAAGRDGAPSSEEPGSSAPRAGAGGRRREVDVARIAARHARARSDAFSRAGGDVDACVLVRGGGAALRQRPRFVAAGHGHEDAVRLACARRRRGRRLSECSSPAAGGGTPEATAARARPRSCAPRASGTPASSPRSSARARRRARASSRSTAAASRRDARPRWARPRGGDTPASCARSSPRARASTTTTTSASATTTPPCRRGRSASPRSGQARRARGAARARRVTAGVRRRRESGEAARGRRPARARRALRPRGVCVCAHRVWRVCVCACVCVCVCVWSCFGSGLVLARVPGGGSIPPTSTGGHQHASVIVTAEVAAVGVSAIHLGSISTDVFHARASPPPLIHGQNFTQSERAVIVNFGPRSGFTLTRALSESVSAMDFAALIERAVSFGLCPCRMRSANFPWLVSFRQVEKPTRSLWRCAKRTRSCELAPSELELNSGKRARHSARSPSFGRADATKRRRSTRIQRGIFCI